MELAEKADEEPTLTRGFDRETVVTLIDDPMERLENEMWHRTSVTHSRESSLDLFARDVGGFIEIAIVFAKGKHHPVCPIIDMLVGKMAAITFDQRKNPVHWRESELPDSCLKPDLDMRVNRRRSKDYDTLDYLKYHIANAVNAAFEDRGFSRYVKRAIVGEWAAGDCRLVCNESGSFEIKGSPTGTLAHAPRAGRWSVGGNMMWLMELSGSSGIRTQVVALRADQLLLPGEQGALYTIYEKAD